MNKYTKLTALAFAASLAFAATSAHATNGVYEINQACAEGPGCFEGDDPGFPVEITKSGSYRLTSSLVKPIAAPANTDGIHAVTPGTNVALDLNGFALDGFMYGIDIQSNVRLKNGQVMNSNWDAVRVLDAGAIVSISDVTLANSKKAGVFVGGGQVSMDRIHAVGNENGVYQTGVLSYLFVQNSTFMGNRLFGVSSGYCKNNFFINNQTSNAASTNLDQLGCADPKQTNLCSLKKGGPWAACGRL